eukprot:403370622
MKENSAAFSFGLSKRESHEASLKKSVPGPGAYHDTQKSNITFDGAKASPGWRIGSEKRNIFGKEINSSIAPGPGVYDIQIGTRVSKGKLSPNVTMGQKFMESKINNPEDLPGPGSYDISDEKEKRKKSYSIGLKFQRNLLGVKEGPGPGAYNIDKADSQRTSGGVGSSVGAQFSFPKDERKDIDKKTINMPDPTSYQPIQKNSSIPITLGMKLSIETASSKQITPGPGTYTITSGFQKFRNSMNESSSRASQMRYGQTESRSGTRQNLLAKNSPGPGSYLQSIDKIYKNERGTKFGSSIRKELTPQDIAEYPGPSQYLPNISLIKKSAANWKLRQLIHDKSQTSRNTVQPGPGEYEFKINSSSEVKQAPIVSMGKRLDKSVNLHQANPSPLHYDPKMSFVKMKSPSVKIGSQPQRISLAEKGQLESPAPDTYFKNVDLQKAINKLKGKESGPQWSMGTSQRYQIGGQTTRDSRNIPGPGNYQLPPTIGNIPHYEKAKMKTFQ